jgi:hypothetical protein
MSTLVALVAPVMYTPLVTQTTSPEPATLIASCMEVAALAQLVYGKVGAVLAQLT